MRTRANGTKGPNPWRVVDPLGDALRFLRMNAVFYCRSEFTARWGLAIPPFERSMMFHIVTEGESWIAVDGAEPCLLRPGVVALVPRGEGHRVLGDLHASATPLFETSRELVSDRYEVLRHGGGGTAASMLCGLVQFDHPAADDLIAILPKVLQLDVTGTPHAEWLQSTLRLVTAEAQALRAGGDAVITRLADVLVLEIIRSWITRAPAEQVGWLGALRDRQIGHAVSLIQRDPTRRWTVGSLATAIGMSRSAFAARFTELVGKPVMHYVTQWKMHDAHLSLRHERTSVSELADRLGYSTEAAFSRAFKRVTGRSPGAVRRQDHALSPS
jgi:AraC-like DNA-binding protein